MCLLQFSVCNTIQAFIFCSLSTRIGFVALILLVLWSQNTRNMEDWLLLKYSVKGFDKQSQENYKNKMFFSYRGYIQAKLFAQGGRNLGNSGGILCSTVQCHLRSYRRLPLAMPPDKWMLGIQTAREVKVQFLFLNGKVRGKMECRKKVWRENFSAKERVIIQGWLDPAVIFLFLIDKGLLTHTMISSSHSPYILILPSFYLPLTVFLCVLQQWGECGLLSLRGETERAADT